MNSRTYKLSYPERRSVSAETLIIWATDAVRNGEWLIEGKSVQECIDEVQTNVQTAIDVLEDCGHIDD